MAIHVLRLGHRVSRDKRVSTHIGLVARQFGADRIIYTGERDSHLMKSLEKIQDKWGKSVEVEYSRSWKDVVKRHRSLGFAVVHLTMYGMPLHEKSPQLAGRNILVVVGGEKVPGEIYRMTDYNISVGNQPHSEIAALAIFLDRLVEWEKLEFKGKVRVVPSERGKHIEKTMI